MVELLKKALAAHPRTNVLILLLFLLPLVTIFVGKKAGLFYQAVLGVSTAGTEQSKVALVKWPSAPTDAEVEHMVQTGLDSALGSGGFRNLVRDKRVVIKVNLGSGYDRWEVTSAPVVKAVVNALKMVGAASITILEGRDDGGAGGSFGSGSANSPEVRADYGGLAGVQYVNSFTALTRPVTVADGVWPSGQAVIMPQVYLDADVVISMPKMKTHNRPGITVGLKNVFGVPPLSAYNIVGETTYTYREKLHQLIASKSITQLNLARPPDLVVTDAILAGEGAGPWGCTEKVMNTIIVSADPVAADAVAASVMGFAPESIRHLVYASFKGLGNFEMDYIDVLGATINSVRQNFQQAAADPITWNRKVMAIGSLPTAYSKDGNVEEWQTTKRPARVAGTGAGAQIWTAQDGGKLYIAAQVSDTQLDSQDGLKIYFSHADPNARRADSHPSYQADDFKLTLPYGSFCTSPCTAIKRDSVGGYTVEIEIPLSQLGDYPGLNKEIGFDLGLINNGSLTVWGGDLGIESNPSKMGVALLTSGLGPAPLAEPVQTVTPRLQLEGVPDTLTSLDGLGVTIGSFSTTFPVTRQGSVFIGTLSPNLAAGAYTLRVKGPKHLTRSLPITLTTSGTITADFTAVGKTLLAGDINSPPDDRVDMPDVGILITSYGAAGESAADLNYDGRVDIMDVGYLIRNYGMVGE